MNNRRYLPILFVGAALTACNPPEAPEEAVGAASGSPHLAEIAAASGLDFRHDSGRSANYLMPEIMSGGVGWIDYDGDGDLDLYFTQGGSLGAPSPRSRDRLYRNDGTLDSSGEYSAQFTDVTEQALLAADHYGHAVTVGDYDGDGDPDLYLSNVGPNQLWNNVGDGTFREVTTRAGVTEDRWSTSALMVDLDDDSLLDLFVVNYLDAPVTGSQSCPTTAGEPDYCGPVTYRPLTDRLFINLGNGSFEDRSLESRIATREGSGLGAVAADFTFDGQLDLYVANDKMENFLWEGKAGSTFTENASLLGLAVNENAQAEASMGLDRADIDHDGNVDLVVAHLAGETNTLYRAQPSGWYQDESFRSGLGTASLPRTAFGIAWVDYDRDGLLDLITANGHVHKIPERFGAAGDAAYSQRLQGFRNVGQGKFEVDPAWDDAVGQGIGRGLASGDFDNDGAPDVVITFNHGQARLLHNRFPTQGAWIGVDPRSTGECSITVGLTDARTTRTYLTSRQGSYASARDPRVAIPISASRNETLTVSCFEGTSRLQVPARNAYWVLPPGTGTP